jgi:hypothetical protein
MRSGHGALARAGYGLQEIPSPPPALPRQATLVSMVLDVPTIVTAAIFIGVAAPIALIVPIAIRLAMRVVTVVASVRANHTGRQSKDTCDHDVASYTIEGIHGLSPRGQRSG